MLFFFVLLYAIQIYMTYSQFHYLSPFFFLFLKERDKLTAPLSVAFLRKPETAGILASVWVFIFQTGLKERRESEGERNATSIQRHAVR